MLHLKKLTLLITVFILLSPYSFLLHLKAQECTSVLNARMRSGRVIFLDSETNQFVSEDVIPEGYFYDFSMSPNCRFIIGKSVGYNDCNPGFIIWDSTTSERLYTLSDGYCDAMLSSPPRLYWNDDNSAVLISRWSSGSAFTTPAEGTIWFPDENRSVSLNIRDGIAGPHYDQVYWDNARNWVWSSGLGGVTAYDVNTGEQVIHFTNPPGITHYSEGPQSFFVFSPDSTKVIVYGQRDWRSATNPAMTVYDIGSGNHVVVNVELNAAGTVAISPDNRYLTMTYTAIRVWDLQNLADSVDDRLPIHRFGLPSRDAHIYFADNITLVAESGDTVLRWNVQTGQVLK